MRSIEHDHHGDRLGRWSALALLYAALGCGGSQSQSRPARDPHADSEVSMHAPPAAPADGPAELGALEPVPVPAHPEPTPAPSAGADSAPPAPIRIARDPQPEPYPVQAGTLTLGGGLIIHDVPSTVSARSVREQGSGAAVIELVGARGKRLALLKETSLTQVALPAGASLLAATATTRLRDTRSDWASAPVQVVVDRFQSDTHLYNLERLAKGTDWIWAGMELTPHPAEP